MKTERKSIAWIKIKRVGPIVTNQIKCNRQWIADKKKERKKRRKNCSRVNGQVPVSPMGFLATILWVIV